MKALVWATGPSERKNSVALSEIDRNLLERCLQRKPRAWEDLSIDFSAWSCTW